jgi:geranylgeranyl pyrophosphate synthase
LATADIPSTTSGQANSGRSRNRRRTSHLKLVPETEELRLQLRDMCRQAVAQLDRENPLTKDEMERIVRQLLDQSGMPEGYVGWMMVILATAFWQEQVAATPPSRRLFLLPHCLKHAEGCPADYDEFGLDCERCGACSIADFRTMAEKMGYKVLVAEGSPIVMKIIISGHVDAIVGVACLNVLEKAIDKILAAGIPCMAVPLLSSDCRNTSVDENWVNEMINEVRATAPTTLTRSYIHLMRCARQMFEPDTFEKLAPRARSNLRLDQMDGETFASIDPLAATEAIAYDFLTKSGKYSRPFITLSVHDALTGAHATLADGKSHLEAVPDGVKRAAMSIETFHKASLVHDDIEDDDEHRYGELTLHRRYGVPSAINLGDYLIGMGYRLVGRDIESLGSDVAANILAAFAEAHQKLSEGQGAELFWRDSRDKRLTPIDALKIYALKTAPAFEAALVTGAALAGQAREYSAPFKQFARNLGIGFQILNDLNDWRGDDNNKLAAGGDVLGGRPTLLWALALEALSEVQQNELLQLVVEGHGSDAARLVRIRQLFGEADVFEKAHRMVDKHRQRAERIADDVQPDDLRRLLYFLIDTVLETPSDEQSVVTLSTEVAPVKS